MGKTLNILRILFVIFVVFLSQSVRATPSGGLNEDIQLERLIYLTPNLDSLTRSFTDRGFRVVRGPFDPLGVTTNYVWLPSGQIIELTTTYSHDTSDWRVKALAAYGTHVAGVRLRVRSLAQAYAAIASTKTELQGDSSVLSAYGFGERADSAFALIGPKPLEIVISGSDSSEGLPAYNPTSTARLRRITWILLTASDSTEAMLRRTFDDLGLHRSHAGCCDYWIIGPPENRTGIRFELPSTTFKGEGDWLSIEPGGVVFN